MASRLFFNGRLYSTPIAVSAVDDSLMAPRNVAVGNNVAILGIADGGQPNKPLTYGSPRDAEKELKGGELLRAVRKAFAPSAVTGGPFKVTVVRVGQASQSTLTLLDDANRPCIELTSDLYGLYANAIRVQIEDGTDFGKRITTRVNSQYYIADNLGKSVFTVKYDGSMPQATLDITPTQCTIKALKNQVTLDTAATVSSGASLTFSKTATVFAATADTFLRIPTLGLYPGMAVSGTNVAANTTITKIVDADNLYISTNPTATIPGGTLLTFSVTTPSTASSSSSTTLAVSTAFLEAGMAVSGTGVTPGTTIASITGQIIAAVDLHNFRAVQLLVEKINTYAGFTAVVERGANADETLRALDGVVLADVKTTAITVSADLNAIIEWFNGNAERFATAVRPLDATQPPKNIGYTYMSGALDPLPTLSDWFDAIDLLTEVDVQHIVPLSSSPAVHTAVDAHCEFMSTAGRKERRAYVGPKAGFSKEQAMLGAHAIASDRTAYCWPAHFDNDLVTGDRILLPAYFSAVNVAAGFAGLSPGTPMTNKSVRFQGLEYSPSNPVDTDDLIQAGVCTFQDTPKGIKVVRSISTWLDNDNFNRVEISCGIATDYTVRAVREALEVLIGSKASPIALARAVQITKSTLMYLAKPEPAGPAVIVGDEKSPAFTNIVADIDGDILSVAFQCSPVVPINFITLAVSIVPYRGSLKG